MVFEVIKRTGTMESAAAGIGASVSARLSWCDAEHIQRRGAIFRAESLIKRKELLRGIELIVDGPKALLKPVQTNRAVYFHAKPILKQQDQRPHEAGMMKIGK